MVAQSLIRETGHRLLFFGFFFAFLQNVKPIMKYKIKTERLILGVFDEVNIERRVELANDFDVARMTASMPFPYTLEDAIGWVQGHDAGRAAGTDYPFAIRVKGEGLAGAIGLHKKNGPLFELGYWLGRPFWGKGYATEAAFAVMNWAQETLGVTALTAAHFEDNPASGKVLKKLGFVPIGTTSMDYSIARGGKARGINLIWHA